MRAVNVIVINETPLIMESAGAKAPALQDNIPAMNVIGINETPLIMESVIP
jgi:hypothetical protein